MSLVPDNEVAAVLIALAPLDDRLARVRQRLDERREFDVDQVLDNGWSTGERHLIQFAGALWKGRGQVDLGYIAASLGGEFFQAVIDALAAYRQENFTSDAAAAYATCLVPA